MEDGSLSHTPFMGLNLSRPPSGAPRAPRPDCPFCAIVAQGPAVAQSGRAVAFRDRAPAAVGGHFLVVPRNHIGSIYDLDGEDDVKMMNELEALGQEVALAASSGPSPPRIKTGFHFPPLYSVDHLHLHVFVLPHTSWWARLRFLQAPGAPWCATPAQVRARVAARRWVARGGSGGGKRAAPPPPGARMV